MISKRVIYNFYNAYDAFLLNRVRSFLTALGIIFGVAAVIAMMAIGNGARKEILDQIKLVGVNNIIIMPKLPGQQEEEATQAQNNQNNQAKPAEEKEGKEKGFSPGLTLADASSISKIIPTVLKVSPEIIYDGVMVKDGVKSDGKISGVTPDFFQVFNIRLDKGSMFTDEEMQMGSPVCIISTTLESRFFSNKSAIGNFLRCGGIWFKVIGVTTLPVVKTKGKLNLGITDNEKTVFIPIKSLLLRFLDRSYVDVGAGGRRTRGSRGAQMILNMNFSPGQGGEANYHQLDKIVVQVKESGQLAGTTAALTEMLNRRHGNNDDFEIKVPELLLKQEQRTKDIFNIVLGAIAGISLIVGGIGIMNIMLASVLERTKEIGIRLAIGARKTDIIMQFLFEATLLSIIGGLIGILIGVFMARLIMGVAGILTIVSLPSILISFCVSAAVGIVFGYMPAKRAAMQDPVASLRYE